MKALSTGRFLRFEGIIIYYEYLDIGISQQDILSKSCSYFQIQIQIS